MVALLDWPSDLPQRMLEQGFREQPEEGLVDKYPGSPPIYFTRSRARTRRVTGTLRLTYHQRDIFLQREVSLRGKRFNADFENLGATRETTLEDWSLGAAPNGVGFHLGVVLTVFDVGQVIITINPTEGVLRLLGGVPTVIHPDL